VKRKRPKGRQKISPECVHCTYFGMPGALNEAKTSKLVIYSIIEIQLTVIAHITDM